MAPTARPSPPEIEAVDAASDLEGLVGYNMKRAYVAIQKDFRAALGDGGLGTRTFSALSLVVAYPNLSQSGLARMLGIERSGLVAIVDDLERAGYLARSLVPGDRRVQALVPTKAGIAAYRAALATVQAHEDRVLAGLSPSDRATLLDLLRRIRMTDAEG